MATIALTGRTEETRALRHPTMSQKYYIWIFNNTRQDAVHLSAAQTLSPLLWPLMRGAAAPTRPPADGDKFQVSLHVFS